jgi:hypothetical protein
MAAQELPVNSKLETRNSKLETQGKNIDDPFINNFRESSFPWPIKELAPFGRTNEARSFPLSMMGK